MKMSSVNSSVKPNEVKREEFRKYLEHAGVMDAITNILISLYEENEKPEDALEYIQRYLDSLDPNKADYITQIDNLKKELVEAKVQISDLKEKLLKYECTGDTA